MAHVSILDPCRRVERSSRQFQASRQPPIAKFHINFSIREREKERRLGSSSLFRSQFFSVSLHTLQFYFNIPGFKSKQKPD
ncbi:hypothetical protein LWI28_005942 [Acer negundo]|uniref:Uncharacterized protein n=1 Tax=Acer negundo TaxID=4023 RepID=A0AAD5JGT6_ACENE|nr:hypothetical protein LWI28_005942 [Acer negundo]